MQEEIKKPLVQQGGFEITIAELEQIFVQEHINDGDSMELMHKLEGYEGLENKLKTNKDLGIRDDPAEKKLRQKTFGNNYPIVKEATTICELICNQLGDRILQILIAASFVSSAIGIWTEGWKHGWLEGFAILVAVLVILSVTAINDYMKEKQFRKLYAKSEARFVDVKREGKWIQLLVNDLLVGDVMKINTGEILPVDGVLFKVSSDMMADESSITGESDAVKKGIPKEFSKENKKLQPFLISGSKILDGDGEMFVCQIGKNSRFGRLKETLQATDDQTPLQEKLEDLANDIGKVGMMVACLVFFSMMINLLVDYIYHDKMDLFLTKETLQEVVYFFIIAVTMVVVAVPEGLPLAVTMALAISVGKMYKENNLVRYLQACETMGGANNVCSDKTGTLTTNKMTVVDLYAQSQVHNTFEKEKFSKQFLDTFCICASINSTALPVIQKDGSMEERGNKTECALLQLAFKLGFNYEDERKKWKVLKTIPFSSARKKMSCIIQLDDKTLRVFCKGAPDYIIAKCVSFIAPDGQVQKLQSDEIKRINDTMKGFSKQSLRCLLLTYKDIPFQQVENMNEDELESDLVFAGLAGIKDPLRPGIKESVQKCKKASVTVRMVTGDIPETAIAIAKDAGILEQDFNEVDNKYAVMKGVDFRNFVGGLVKKPDPEKPGETKMEVGNLQHFEIVAQNLRVMARSQPEDKFLLVLGLKQLGHVVAVTGDGTNDAPALKKADVGFAMGIAGTEVAKEASGIILLDDNFTSIITAIKYGRNVFDCIRKFLQFQLTINCVAIFMVFFGGAVLRESPITAIQMLWVNLIMDTMASLALATEPPTDELLKRRPYGRNEYIITPVMWRNIIGHAFYQIILLLCFLFLAPDFFDIQSSINVKPWTPEKGIHYTLLFNTFVCLQVFNEINARKLKKNEFNVFHNFFDNPFFFIILIVTFITQYFIVQFGGRAFRCSPLSYQYHLICLGIGSTSLIVGLLIKLVPEGCFQTIKLFRESPHIEQQEAQGITGAFKAPIDLLKGSSSRKFSRSSRKSKNSIESGLKKQPIQIEQQATNKLRQ